MQRTCPQQRLSLRATAALVVAAFVGEVWAAVPVEESTGTTVRPRTGSAATSTTTSSDVRTYGVAASDGTQAPPAAGGTAQLFYQLQLLQSEIGELRGILEEQQHRIERLEASQKEQYLDIDRRLSALAGTASAAPRPSTDGASPSASAPVPTGSVAASSDEQSQFNAAYKLVTTGRFQDAVTALGAFLRDFPDGKFAPNAYYWLGEAYLGLPTPDLERARHAFTQLPQRYSTSNKVPDALFKLGAVYHSLGDTAKAMDFFNRVQREYPGSAAAQLAQSYAAEL